MGAAVTGTGTGSGEAKVEVVAELTSEVLEAVRRLFPQLSSSAPPGEGELAEILSSDATTLLMARDASGAIVGMLTLAVFRIPSGLRAWVEDVVTDTAARGKGIGAALVRSALSIAAERGCVSVDLTSRPSREAANRLYRRLGFLQRETNVYRFELSRQRH